MVCVSVGKVRCMYIHHTLPTLKQTTHQSQSFSALLISVWRLKIYTILHFTSFTTQPYLLLIRKYYHIYLKFSITHNPQQNYSPVFLHTYYKTLPNISVVPPQQTIRTYMGTLLKFYLTPTSTSSYIKLETNTILLASGHNSYNRTKQVVPLLKKSMYGSPFSTILHRLCSSQQTRR
jgi:hypothetical protein